MNSKCSPRITTCALAIALLPIGMLSLTAKMAAADPILPGFDYFLTPPNDPSTGFGLIPLEGAA
jgi:hypothetical protein